MNTANIQDVCPTAIVVVINTRVTAEDIAQC